MADTPSKIDAAADKASADAAENTPAKAKSKVTKTVSPKIARIVAADNEAAVTAAHSPHPITKLKDTIMATAATDYTAKAKELAADMQTRAKAAYDKGAAYAGEATEFSKGNLEAMMTSGKILAGGMQDLGRTYVEDVKSAVETMTGDVKAVAAVRSPTELFQLQGEIARRNFDAVVKTTSKNSEALLKLANEAFAPLSTRMSLAMERIKTAA